MVSEEFILKQWVHIEEAYQPWIFQNNKIWHQRDVTNVYFEKMLLFFRCILFNSGFPKGVAGLSWGQWGRWGLQNNFVQKLAKVQVCWWFIATLGCLVYAMMFSRESPGKLAETNIFY